MASMVSKRRVDDARFARDPILVTKLDASGFVDASSFP
jgi:hypothetical protein